MKRWTVYLSAVIVGGAVGLLCSAKPWQEAARQRSKSQGAKAEMRQLEAQRADLIGKTARFESANGMEAEARAHGYRRPDERPIDITP
ncbi:MAG: hypothetical protein KF857_02835 [Fimbriimonadaceae bacterium]|nr:hypothetical protein [Fimbriimonadaceae bacterium]